VNRRGALVQRRWILGAAASLLAGCDSQRPRTGALGLMERWNEKVERLLFSPGRRARELPASAETNPDDFPVYHISDELPLLPAGWAFKVGGLVARPRLFSLAEVQRLPSTSLRVRHHCVEGWSAVASWNGVRISDVAAVVGADPRAQCVEFRSFDEGYYSSWDRESALHDQTLLAYGMNGRPLGPAHGAPLRVYSAVKLGYKQVKYLTEMNFLPARPEGPGQGYWEDRGYEWYAGV
jgi:DMSO/TMAO reductase YedYZ molybdopterin-dependent catalytic subunit